MLAFMAHLARDYSGESLKIQHRFLNVHLIPLVRYAESVCPGLMTSRMAWADTVVVKPKYFEVKDPALAKLIAELPERVEIPEDTVNPVRSLPELVKKILFTKSPAEYYEKGLAPDKWRFNGVTPNVVQLGDSSLGNWPLLSWLGASQTYFDTTAKIAKTGKKHNFEAPYIFW